MINANITHHSYKNIIYVELDNIYIYIYISYVFCIISSCTTSMLIIDKTNVPDNTYCCEHRTYCTDNI